METSAMFEQASRLKLRFATTRGEVTVEDLWDLPLTSTVARPSLDAIALALHVEIRNTLEVASFVAQPVPNAAGDTLRLKFEIVKHVIAVRIKERDELRAAADRKEKKQRLLELIARKEDEALGSKSVDELRQMVESL